MNIRKTVIFWVLIFAVVFTVGSLIINQENEKATKYSDIIQYFKDGKVESFVVNEQNVLMLTIRGDDLKKVEYRLRTLDGFREDIQPLMQANEADENKKVVSYDYKTTPTLPWIVGFIPYILVIVAIAFIYYSFLKKQNTAGGAAPKDSGSGGFGGFGGRMSSFSRARAKLGSDEKNKVMFADVAGADEEKEELEEIVEFLKEPSKFTALGAKIPKGVLLVGAPGTGKTLLAKAVAGESGVPFYSISGSDFVEMYVGVGASRVRDLFDTAKKTAPSIVFIDEIDAVGRHRGAGWGGGHDEREQTLNQLLVEMDGFGGHEGVIVIAATNRPDILDPALLRPGRFDRQITVNYPDLKGREAILKVHARKKPLEESVDLSVLAKTTVGFTGADLANILNEAALLAARKNKKLIGMKDIEEATMKVIIGPQKRSMVIKTEEKRKTAYHEAGHAIVGHLCKTQDPVHHISIIPSGRALGYTLSLPKEDKYSVYKVQLEEEIAVLLGGRVAEKLILDDISGGASNDIKRATSIARKMVTRYGMSDLLGPIMFGSDNDEVFLGKDYNQTRNYSEEVAAQIDSEIHKIVEKSYKLAEKLLTENMDKLHFIADFLVNYEIMDGDQFTALMNGNPTVEELLAIKTAKEEQSKEENQKKSAAEKSDKKPNSAEKVIEPNELDSDISSDRDETDDSDNSEE
ncbi:MAG: ATP-dependent zinc metalloprotease FtsH [Eubacteriales bacterium]|nr:ATP-dependent zinc metalloprotease FtsH [Eubacteriales bacterium]MDD4474522.1 ATP-dependent zinc metalloprotease FtsH [Eubacteriales bacterium]